MLNRCPSCQASVLDDDAEACPFCGSPMDPAKAKNFKPAPAASTSGTAKAADKPKSKPAASGTAKPTASKSAASKPGQASAKSAHDDDDDPFATDASATAGAIALSRKPTAQRSHKIVCPMCDTVGFAPTAASGKDVRCSNPKCMVPVFTAPDFAAPKTVAPEPQPSGPGPLATTFGLIGGLVVCGAAIWWFVLRDDTPPPDIAGPVTPPPVAPSVDPEPDDTTPSPPDNGEPPPPAPAETLAVVSQQWPRITEDISQPQRQSLLKRYGAESYALAGQVAAAREQITKLQAMRSGVPSFAIPPLVEVAWTALRNGNEAEARAAVEEAAALVGRIPQQGFDPARVTIGFSSAAARFGREKEARDLAKAPRDDAAGEQLLALLESARLFSDGDLSAEYPLRPVWPSAQPKSIAVGLDLLNRAATDQAKAWAEGESNTLTRAEILASWAEAMVLAGQGSLEQRTAAINEAIEASQPAERVLVLSRAAIRLAAGNQQAAAEGLFSTASEAIGQLTPAEPLLAASLEEIDALKLPAMDDVRLNAAALAEAAHAASLLGKTDEAGRFASQALDRLRSAAPSVASVDQRQKEYDATRSSLDDRRRNEYRRKLNEVRSAATQRFALQVELLARAIEWRLGPQLIAEAKERNGSSDASTKEPYFSGNNGGRLLAAALLADDKATETELRTAGVANTSVPGREALMLTVKPMLAAERLDVNELAATGREFQANRRNRLTRSDWLGHSVRTACRIAKQRTVEDAYRFAMAHSDDFVREELLRYLSVCVAQAGQAAKAAAFLTKTRPLAADEAAALRGLTEGLIAIGAGSTQPPPTAVSGTTTPRL